MRLRSLLFVPGDRPERFAKAAESGADAIILDLEDAVRPSAKARARDNVTRFLEEYHPPLRLVRVNACADGFDLADLAGAARADGIVLPKCQGSESVATALKAMRANQQVLPICMETAVSLFSAGTYSAVAPHLLGLTWGAEDLGADLGAAEARLPDGSWSSPFELARSVVLFGARAAGVEAIETVYPAVKDEAGLRLFAARAESHGFGGMMAVHPLQVSVINACFSPDQQAVDEAMAVLDACGGKAGVGVTTINGKMIDGAHVARAHRILERVGLGARVGSA